MNYSYSGEGSIVMALLYKNEVDGLHISNF